MEKHMMMKWARLHSIAMGAALLATAITAANATEVRGIADLPYKNGLFSKGPDAELRQQALNKAKTVAWKRYTSTFSPSRMQSYQRVEEEILANLDQYLIDINILDELVNNDTQLFSVAIRASINEAVLNAKLNGDGASASGNAGDGELFSFIFVAREVESLKSFDARRTEIRLEENELSANQQGAARGGSASIDESTSSLNKTTQGGSTLRKANEISYRVRSGSDVDAAMTETLTGYGFDVVGYPDVVANCGGTSPDMINKEFSETDDMSIGSRQGAINAARNCEVNYFAVGTLDIGLNDIDPVTGNQRVHVSVRGQVWDISKKLPRRIASVGPVQYAGLGPDPEVAMRNALRLSASQSAKVIVDQLNAKRLR
jgi:hypothetical protein